MAIGESVLSTVVSIRDKIAHHKKLEKWEQDFRRDNSKYFINRRDVQEAENILDKLWNKGGEN